MRVGSVATALLALCIPPAGASAADNAARQAAAGKESSRRIADDRDCCVKKPTDFGSKARREPNALDRDPEGWRVQGPERYPDAVGMEHCQIQRGQRYQMAVELRAGTRRGKDAWTSDQVERARRLIAKKEEVEKRCCADFDRCEREARDAWRTKTGGSDSD